MVLEYATYLRCRADECISLAVEEPWDESAAALIDLARDYCTLAERFRSAPPEAHSDDSFTASDAGGGTGIFMLVRRIAGYSS